MSCETPGPAPYRVRWRGHDYPGVGWALADLLRERPLLSDREAGDELGVSVRRVQMGRARAGIPERRRRSASNPYLELPREEWRGGPGRWAG